ncbi:Plasminogen [Clonorchis sinensis]|uniref:Plasminogen n=1 Tax=Clonorchis sinensis TaxID=79923 RepID=A0A419PSC4_CLOSI|nr:Plasminogen [Clonorchis sinensis]
MQQSVWWVVTALLLLHLSSVCSRQSPKGGEHGNHHSAHGGGSSLCCSGRHQPNESNGHGGGTVVKSAHHYGHHQCSRNKTTELKHQMINFGFLDGNALRFKPEKMLVFNDDRYEPWSNWSECIKKDCIEVRFRKCKDDSWTQPSPNKIHTTKCLSKFFAEKRTCQNTTVCNSHVIPEKLSETCGIRPNTPSIVAKIVGGEVATPHSWPWAVRLSVKPPGRRPISFCAATLVAPQWVLTAAHCLLVENKRMPVGRMVNLRDQMKSILYVHFGDHDKTKLEEVQQDIRVEKVILHPRYHRKLMADGDDIALLYLPKAVNITPEVSYACLPTKDVQVEPGTQCYAVGWGSTEAGRTPTFDNINSILDALFLPGFGFSSPFFSRPFSMSPFFRRSQDRAVSRVLREVDLPVISNKECRKYYPDLNEDVHICAGSKGKDTCAGDSGGGLYCQLPRSGRWFVVGVTSFGLARGCGTNPGVYTSVIGHLDWITQVMATSVY